MEATSKATKSTAEVAREYFAAVADRDVEGMIALWRTGAGTGSIHGMVELTPPEDYRRWFGAMFRAFPDIRFEVADLTCDGEKAAVHWAAEGTFSGTEPFEGLIPNGKPVKIAGIDLLTVRDGLIDELRAYTNATVMLRQLGALPDAGSAQERAMLGALNLKTKVAGRLKRVG